MRALCRDCLARFDEAPGQRCPSCGRARLLAHRELDRLAIAHVDCDAFYASVEKRDDPTLADRPLIVGGGRRGVVTTCCYIARIAGVRSAMPMFKALRLCPGAVVLKPRMAVYVEASRAIRALMERMTPLVEPLSLDEAFLDLSGTERLFGEPPALRLARLALEVERSVGVSVSIGLSHNKSLAKLASDLDKPRGFAVVGRAETEAFLAPRSVRTIWGVGPRLADRLEGDGLRTNADIARAPEDSLIRRYGSMGRRLARLARGEDDRRVDPDSRPKSISSETTFEDDLVDAEQLRGHLWRLAVRTSDRAKAKGIEGGGVVLKLKTARFRLITRQARAARPTNLAETVYRLAEPLVSAALGDGPFRLIGVGLNRLAPADPRGPDATLFADPEAALARTEAATDAIRARFGPDAIILGRALR